MHDAAPDFETIKTRQQATWASGDYAVLGATLQLSGEMLCEALDVRAGWKLLDVAAGNGNVTLAAARRGCRVTSTDYVPALLERGRLRAEAEGWRIDFQVADAEDLPFPDASFDAVTSTFGVMFTPNSDKSSAEMMRVAKPGGKIGLANWTPAGFVGQIFKIIGKYVPPIPGLRPPVAWGTVERLDEMFAGCAKIEATVRHFNFRTRSEQAWFDEFRKFYGPLNRTFATLEPAHHAALEADLVALAKSLNRATDGTMVLPSEYLEVVITR